MTAARLALMVPLAFALDAAVTRALLRFAPSGTAAGFAQPLAVATNWNAFGASLLAALALATVLAGWAYWRLIARLREGDIDGVSPASVAGTAALALLCAWFVPVLFSSDVYAYAAYGEMLRSGLSAYAHAPLPPGNPIFAAAIWQWGNPPPVCVYGPAFVAVAAAVLSGLHTFGTLVQLDGLRALASLALIACSIGAYYAYPGERRERLAAAATIGLNPVAIWCAAEGHNDALALAVVLAGFALLRRGVPGAGAAIVALAGSIKAPGVAAALPLAFAAGRARFGALAGIAAVVALSYPLLRAVATDVAPGGHYAPQASLQAVFAFAPLAGALAAMAACALLARAAVACLRRRDAAGWPLLALAAWVLVPNPYPWYGLWLTGAAALAPGSRAARAALLLSLVSILRYLPDAVAVPAQPYATLLGIAAVLPLAALR
jgi:hypothetical protein